MRLDELINENYKKLNDSDLHVLQYIKNHGKECPELSISQLSARCNVSSASILRMAKKLNFSGYSELKYFLRRENQSQPEEKKRDTIKELNDDIAQTIKVFRQNRMQESLYRKIERADTIYAFGTGHGQRIMLQEFARCFLNVNKNVILLPASTELKIAKENFRETDLLFIASLSGNIAGYKETIRDLEVRGIPMVSVTNLDNNELASFTEYNFYFQNSDIDENMKLNRSSYLTLHLVLHLIYEGYVEYLAERTAPSHRVSRGERAGGLSGLAEHGSDFV